jgi:hypothetical protein
MRPKPLMPTRTVMLAFPPASVSGPREVGPSLTLTDWSGLVPARQRHWSHRWTGHRVRWPSALEPAACTVSSPAAGPTRAPFPDSGHETPHARPGPSTVSRLRARTPSAGPTRAPFPDSGHETPQIRPPPRWQPQLDFARRTPLRSSGETCEVVRIARSCIRGAMLLEAAVAFAYSSSSRSALRPASVFGIPRSAARLSAVASSRRIRPATASLVSCGSCS